MMRSLLLLSFTLATAIVASAATPAHAQYYPDRPPPPPPPRYRYDEAPPPPPPPYYYDRRPRAGFRCEAVAETPQGGRSIVCPLRRPQPLSTGCECPPPPPPPGFSYGPPLPGRVIP